MENTIRDIISKPVGETYELVQTLGIYCWQEDINHQDAAFFMPVRYHEACFLASRMANCGGF